MERLARLGLSKNYSELYDISTENFREAYYNDLAHNKFGIKTRDITLSIIRFRLIHDPEFHDYIRERYAILEKLGVE
jgi:hypothetical protein